MSLSREGRPTTPNVEINYEKLIALFTGAHSSELFDRHIGVVDRVCRVNSGGFAIRDLPYIEKILSFLLEKNIEGKADVFADALCKLLRTLSLPFVRRTATDEFKMFNNISSVVVNVSKVFNPNVPHTAQIAAAEMLACFASAHGQRPSVVDVLETEPVKWADGHPSPVPPGTAGSESSNMILDGPSPRQYHTNQRLLERSGAVANTVVNGFTPAMRSENAELRLAIARALLTFSYNAENAVQIVDAGALDSLALALELDFKDPLVFVVVELMWNLFERRHAIDMMLQQDSTIRTICGVLTGVFKELMMQGYRIADKELRNEVCLLATMLAQEGSIAFILQQTGFLRMALAASTSPEFPSKDYELKPFCQTKESEDLELRRLVWGLVCRLCVHPVCLEDSVQGGFLDVLLMYIDVERQSSPHITKYARSQIHELQLQVFAILFEIVPGCPMAYSQRNGNEIVLNFIRSCPQGELKEAAVRHLLNSAGVKEFSTELGEAGGISLALELFCDEENPECVKQDAIAVLSSLCQEHEDNRQRFRKEGGLNALRSALITLKSVDHTLPSAFGVAVMEALWYCVVTNRRNLARFLAADGLDAVIDLLEACNPHLYPVILSCLADILENPKSHVFVHEWKSTQNPEINAAQLLLGIWRLEENARHMCDKSGIIANPTRPMTGSGERTEWIPNLGTAYTFQSPEKRNLMEKLKQVVTGDCIMAKIYSVFHNLGFKTLDYLSMKDKATLTTIEKFIKFKQGEVWLDIEEDFKKEGMRPTAPDRDRLASGIEKSESLANSLAATQEALFKSHYQSLETDNMVFYHNMSEMHKQEAESKVYKRNLSTLTMKERLEAKLKKEQMLKNSFKPALMVE